MTPLPSGFFLKSGTGQRLCLFHAPAGATPRGQILFFHPFAEELNTSRRVVAQQARALAQAGYAVLQFDMLGCGDSSGDFADARWQDWLDDASTAADWLAAHAQGPLWFWGMRTGALLAAESLRSTRGGANLLLWQATPSGQQVLQQFLRLQAAGQWLSGQTNPNADTPDSLLAKGQPVDIAGYTLSPELAQGLAQARLRPPERRAPGRLIWLEVSSQASPSLGLASEMSLKKWREAGWNIQAQAVQAPSFWQTASNDEAPALVAATLAALEQQALP